MFVRTKMRLKGETTIFELKKIRNANEMRSIYIFARISEGDHFLTKSIFVSTSGDVWTTSEPFFKFPYFFCLIAPRVFFVDHSIFLFISQTWLRISLTS